LTESSWTHYDQTIRLKLIPRFNGLVFNDNGTLRMDCGQINDGVAE
jgi:hypothetical protein